MTLPEPPKWGSKTWPMPRPICWPMISPAQLTATKVKLSAVPMAMPKRSSPPIPAVNVQADSGRVNGFNVGAMAAAMTRAKRTLSRRGTRALPKRGALTITPAIRKNARTKVGTSWSTFSNDINSAMSGRSARPTGLRRCITAEHGGGESHQMIGQPRSDENSGGDHGGDFRDEDQRLFLNLGNGLKDGDDEADDEPHDQQRRGDDEGNEKSFANKVAGLIYAHVTPFPACGRQMLRRCRIILDAWIVQNWN